MSTYLIQSTGFVLSAGSNYLTLPLVNSFDNAWSACRFRTSLELQRDYLSYFVRLPESFEENDDLSALLAGHLQLTVILNCSNYFFRTRMNIDYSLLLIGIVTTRTQGASSCPPLPTRWSIRSTHITQASINLFS